MVLGAVPCCSRGFELVNIIKRQHEQNAARYGKQQAVVVVAVVAAKYKLDPGPLFKADKNTRSQTK